MNLKKVLFIAPPFAGHLHPLLGIARAARSVAEVIVISTPTGVRTAQKSDLATRSILESHESRVWEIAEPGRAVKNHPLLLYRQLKSNVGLMVIMKSELDRIYAGEKPDLVIADFTIPVAGLSASALGIPWWTTTPSACVFETPDGPPAYFGGQKPSNRRSILGLHAFQRRSTRVFKQLMWLLFRKSFRSVGFKGIYRDDGSEAVYSPHRIVALGAKEIEFPCGYPPHLHFVGPSLYTPPSDGSKIIFSDDGRPHVLITVGTHLSHGKAPLVETLRIIAARQPGIVFHFSHGKEDAGRTIQLGNLHEYDYVPYAELLERYQLVVHHAGSGVLHHCLRHGVPSVVLPQDFDQFDNAARLIAHGLAFEVRDWNDLEQVMLSALTDGPLRKRCEEMSMTMASYDAGKTVAKWIEEL